MSGTIEGFDDSSNLRLEKGLEKTLDFIRGESGPRLFEVLFDYGFESKTVPVEILYINRWIRPKIHKITGCQDTFVQEGFGDYVMIGVTLPYTLEIKGYHPFRYDCALNPSRRGQGLF